MAVHMMGMHYPMFETVVVAASIGQCAPNFASASRRGLSSATYASILQRVHTTGLRDRTVHASERAHQGSQS